MKTKIVVTWSEEDQCWLGRLPNFPNCVAHGDTPGEAADQAHEAAQMIMDLIIEYACEKNDELLKRLAE